MIDIIKTQNFIQEKPLKKESCGEGGVFSIKGVKRKTLKIRNSGKSGNREEC